MNTETITENTPPYQFIEDFNSLSGNWIWPSIYCLIESPNFVSSMKWISNKLNISLEAAVDGVEGLERLGLIKKIDHSYQVTNANLQFKPDSFADKINFLRNSAELMQQTISKVTSSDKYTVQFFLSNKEILNEYTPKFIALYREMEEKGKLLKATEVTVSHLTLCLLSDELNEGSEL